MSLYQCTIPGRAGIKKNSKRIVRNGRRTFAVPSDTYKAWESKACTYVKRAMIGMQLPITVPVNMRAIFYFENHAHEPDLSNLYQGIEDVLEKCGVILNDKLIYGHDGSRKMFGEESRVEIKLQEMRLHNI